MNAIKTGLLGLAVWADLFASSLSVTSDVTANTAWNADTVFIDREYFEVKEGGRLTIAAGTRVIFRKAGTMLTIRGTLTAVGTPADSIFFSRVNPVGPWKGIRLTARTRPANNRDSSFIGYASLSYTDFDVPDSLYEKRGGVIYCGPGNYVEIGNSALSKSVGYHGGAVYVDSGAMVRIDNCLFSNNAADFYGGGAIMASDRGTKDLLVQNCRFNNNYARTGGAVWLGNRTKAEFNNCVFYRDTTLSINPGIKDLRGGALAIFGPADVTLRNCLIFYCRSYVKGGGIYSEDASIKLINCTVANNTSVYGGGIYFGRDSAASSPLLVNTIEGGNGTIRSLPRDSAGCGIFLDSSVTPIFRYCQLYDTVHDFKIRPYQGEFVTSRYYHTDFLCSMPGVRLSDTVVEGYQLYSKFSTNDPAIDGGTPDTAGLGLPELDLLGQKRIYGSAVDIGAIEYLGRYLPVKHFQPVGENRFSLDNSYSVAVYSLNGRKTGRFTGKTLPQAINSVIRAGVPKGIYFVKTNNPGRQSILEKVLVK